MRKEQISEINWPNYRTPANHFNLNFFFLHNTLHCFPSPLPCLDIVKAKKVQQVWIKFNEAFQVLVSDSERFSFVLDKIRFEKVLSFCKSQQICRAMFCVNSKCVANVSLIFSFIASSRSIAWSPLPTLVLVHHLKIYMQRRSFYILQ